MIQLYQPEISTDPTLNAEESGHIVRVLRRKVGDTVFVTDGKGRRYECVLLDANPRGAIVEVGAYEEIQKPWMGKITIAVAPTKNADRMEWLVEKAVEIGVDRIVLLQCARSERKNMRVDRLRKIAVSAMNQSLKCAVPEVTDMMPFAQFLREEAQKMDTSKYMGYCDAETERLNLTSVCRPEGNVTVLIGPEGDFSPEEVSASRKAGFVPVTFGDIRLRTETAALFALQTVHIVQMLGREGKLKQQS